MLLDQILVRYGKTAHSFNELCS